MTREEAIKGLTSLVEVRRKYVGMQTMKDEIESLEMAIKALEQEPCTDAISKQAVEDAIYDYSRSCDVNYGQIMEFIEKIPSVKPQPKTGHWIKTKEQDDAEPLILWKCSECLTVQRLKTNYCPNCGAKMKDGD